MTAESWLSLSINAVRGAAQQVTDLVLPTWCVGCQAAGADLCQDCESDLRLLMRSPFRAEDGALALPIVEASRDGFEVLPVISASWYRTLVADVVVGFKDHERVKLSRVLAPALAGALQAGCEQLLRSRKVLLVWPPDSLRAWLKRGRSPVGELIGEAVRGHCPFAGLEPAGNILRHTGGILEAIPAGSGQKNRSKASRRSMAAQYRVDPSQRWRLSGAQVLLVDDVLTTGATLHRLYSVLTSVGAQVHGAVVLAATPQAESAGKGLGSVKK